MPENNFVTQSEFSRLMDFDRSYVTQLKQADRLVMDQAGRLVDVKASKAKIKDTADPNRDDVKKRWQKNKQAEAMANAVEKNEEEEVAATSYARSRATKEEYAAKMARIQYEEAVGLLTSVEDVKMEVAAIAVGLRTYMENLQDQLPAELAAMDNPDEIHKVLGEHFDYFLNGFADSLMKGETSHA